MDSGCYCENCPHFVENIRFNAKIDLLKEQLGEKDAQIHELKVRLASAEKELQKCAEKCDQFGTYEDNPIKTFTDTEGKHKSDATEIVCNSEYNLQPIINDFKEREKEIVENIEQKQGELINQIKSEFMEAFKNQEKLHGQRVKLLESKVDKMKEEFNVEIFQKVGVFGQNFEHKILRVVDKKVVGLKKEFEDRLDEQNDDIQNLKDDYDDQYNETENGFKEIRKDLVEETRSIKIIMLGPYREDFERLEDNDASHGALLHKMIQDNADKVILSALISLMRPKALEWKNHEKGYDALDIALISKRDYDIVKLFATSIDDLNRRCEALQYLPKGAKVRRGRDWRRGDDGNGYGLVIGPVRIGGGYDVGRYHVKWVNNDNEGHYFFGMNNKFVITLADE